MLTEDVYITGILRTKLNRGNNNIKPLSHAESKTNFPYYMGPFSWHLESNNVWPIWECMLRLITAYVDGKSFEGDHLSSEHLHANLSINALVKRWKNAKNMEKQYYDVAGCVWSGLKCSKAWLQKDLFG